MSAESTLVFYGLRFDVSRSDMEALELGTHPGIAKARSAAMHFYWGNVGGLVPRYYFFVGRKIAIAGIENAVEVTVNDSDLAKMIVETKSRLKIAGYVEEPKLFVQFIPD